MEELEASFLDLKKQEDQGNFILLFLVIFYTKIHLKIYIV